MRQLLKKNYIELKNMLYDSHSLEAIILLTHNYKTSRAAHYRLEKIMNRECERAIKIDYGLKMLPDTVLHIAKAEEFQWLLQAELKAIKDGLTFGKKMYDNGAVYSGYLNVNGYRQGVGVLI